MVTHDVDEALFLSDRVVMMTQGPEAKVGDTLRVPFARPRDRRAVMNDPLYYELRERIIGFLETNAPQRTVKATPAEAAPSEASAIEALA
jgi:ABC-type nitrate/sulfonate/bicarbonate transport system ATPase subunit